MLDDKRVLVLAADLFEDMELLYPVYRLAEEGVDVTIAGLDDRAVTGKKGHGPVPVDTTVDGSCRGDFDALVIPGGFAPDKLRRSEAVLDLVRDFDAAGKPVAFICHAGWVPISASILKGRRATSVDAIRDDMVNAGVDWVDEAAVVDGNLISARTPADLGPVDEGDARGSRRHIAEASGGADAPQRRRRFPARNSSARAGGAHASQPSSIASRSARLPIALSWTSTAG